MLGSRWLWRQAATLVGAAWVRSSFTNRFWNRSCGYHVGCVPLDGFHPKTPGLSGAVLVRRLQMLCPVCENVVSRLGAWRIASGQIYCSEFCAEADQAEHAESQSALDEQGRTSRIATDGCPA
jgi:hypothetical protein